MIVFDIETTGLNFKKDSITVATIFDTTSNTGHTYNFAKYGSTQQDDFLRKLDEATIIACFNGVNFDLPFIISFFHVPSTRYQDWFCKVFDYYEYCRLLYDCPCSLDSLLAANGFAGKTSSGDQAVVMANNKDWEALEKYCMADTIKTKDLCLLSSVYLPLHKKNKMVQCDHVGLMDKTHNLRFSMR